MELATWLPKGEETVFRPIDARGFFLVAETNVVKEIVLKRGETCRTHEIEPSRAIEIVDLGRGSGDAWRVRETTTTYVDGRVHDVRYGSRGMMSMIVAGKTLATMMLTTEKWTDARSVLNS
jgi:hypothetical protein